MDMDMDFEISHKRWVSQAGISHRLLIIPLFVAHKVGV